MHDHLLFLLELAKMFNEIFKNQVLMTFIIAMIWIMPGFLFITASNRKYKKRQKEKRQHKISQLYPRS